MKLKCKYTFSPLDTSAATVDLQLNAMGCGIVEMSYS